MVLGRLDADARGHVRDEIDERVTPYESRDRDQDPGGVARRLGDLTAARAG